jgi:hypothetical protein
VEVWLGKLELQARTAWQNMTVANSVFSEFFGVMPAGFVRFITTNAAQYHQLQSDAAGGHVIMLSV